MRAKQFNYLFNLVIIGSILFLLSGCGAPMLKTAQKQQIFDNKTIYVYPVHISSIAKHESFDTIVAKQIVSFINTKEGLHAEFRNRTPLVNSAWYMNEAKMFKKSFDAFSGFIKTDMTKGEYGLLVEFLWAPEEIDLHYYLVDKNQSKAVFLALVNSHHPIHKAVKPKSNDEAFTLFCKVFDEDLKELKK